MPYRDEMNNIHPLVAILPQVQTNSDTAIVSAIIDTLGYDSLTFAIVTGAVTDADVTVAITMDHGDVANLSDAAAVPAANLVGTLALAGFGFADDSESRKVGYVGPKRYVRLTATPTGNGAGALPIAAVAILANPSQGPTANPPV